MSACQPLSMSSYRAASDSPASRFRICVWCAGSAEAQANLKKIEQVHSRGEAALRLISAWMCRLCVSLFLWLDSALNSVLPSCFALPHINSVSRMRPAKEKALRLLIRTLQTKTEEADDLVQCMCHAGLVQSAVFSAHRG